MAKVKMEFVVMWSGSKHATLDYLFDGGVVVPLTGAPTGAGKIVVHYFADDTGVHKIEWGLVFPNEKLAGLAAAATIGDGAAQPLANEDEEQEDKWIGSGRAVG